MNSLILLTLGLKLILKKRQCIRSVAMVFFCVVVGFAQNNKLSVVQTTTNANPLKAQADLTSVCPDDGTELAKIFLCGSTSSRTLSIPSSGATAIVWEQLNETSCAPNTTKDCPNIATACGWSSVGTGVNYAATTAGQFRVRYQENGNQVYFFNVYKNALDIPINTTAIYCGKPGEIRVAQLTGYEYSLDGIDYQSSNVFSITTAGDYIIKVRREGATPSDCVFTIPITITNQDLSIATTVTPPTTSNQKGSIQLTASNVREQYFYKITQGSNVINEVGPVSDSNYTFPNLNSGAYTWSVKTDDCNWKSGDITINSISPFQITHAIQPVTCQPGYVELFVTGGTPPYQYFFNGNTTAASSNKITVSVAGTYTIKVVDANNQTDIITVQVPAQPSPLYTIEKVNENCYYPNLWQIKFNVTNANGNSIKYSIDNGLTFSTNPIFKGLSATPAGTTFKTVIEYSYGGVKCTKAEDIIITQPQFGLSATAGVSELIGCLPSPNEDKAKIRITNPQGGTPPYQYSYDNQNSWETNTSVLKPAGEYVFYIKDAIGCVSALNKVIVENIGVPTITVTNDSFNCDGTANSSVTITNVTTTNFTYTYTLDGIVQSSSNFKNLAPGNHQLEVNYQPLIVPTPSNLLKEDFGYGADTTSPGMSAAYCFEKQTPPVTCNLDKNWWLHINDGEYSVTSYIIYPHGAWFRPVDHTTNSSLKKGRYLVVNIKGDDTRPVIYSKIINDIVPNQPISVEFYAANLLSKNYGGWAPNLRIALEDSTGSEISSYNTGNIPQTESWIQYSVSLNPGNNTSLRFTVRSIQQQQGGNDVAIDDISAYQIPKLCAATKTVSFVVPTGKAFDANITNTKNVSCAGWSDGEITITAQNFNSATGYQYSKDNGATWQTAMTSPFKITGLSATNYTVKVRYNAVATGVCVKSFLPITILAPLPLVTTASVSTSATCSRGASITASSSGGTPFYQYELWDELNTTKVRSTQNSGIFGDVPPGKYVIRGLDANGCTNATQVAVTVLKPSEPVPSVNPISDLCYDAVNQATIQIDVVSGTAPFSYSLNGSPSQTSNSFSNLGPGTYNVEVIDSNNCKATTQNINIGNELKVTAVLTKALDCTSSPDAVIKVVISGGIRAIRYRVYKNGAKISTNDIAILDTTTSFMYSVKDSETGSYAFEIIDANGCAKTTNTITINPKTLPEISSLNQIQSILCHGESTAAIKVNIDSTKGIAPFTYWTKNTTTNTSYGNQLSGLPAGTYEITVSDSQLCTNKKNISISEPNKINVTSHAVDITCSSSGISKGSVIVDGVVGGSPSYNYFVTGVNGYNNSELNNSGTTSHTFDVVDFGLYQINVVDANGCSVLQQNIKVSSPPEDLDINVSISTINCASGGTAKVAVAKANAFSSDGPFYFAIYKPGLVYSPTDPSWQVGDVTKSATFTGLLPGVKYTFIVYDDTTKCYHYKTSESAIATNSTLVVSNLEVKNITCKGAADGKVTFTIKNNYSAITSISYQVYNSQSVTPVVGVAGTSSIPANGTITISDVGLLSFGNYFVLVKEELGATNVGCSIASDSFTITESAIDLSLSATILKNVNCNEKGIISVQAKDGTAPYYYQISAVSGATSSPIGSTSLIPPPPPSPDGIWQTSNTFTVSQGGSYTVFVRDAYGCIKQQSVIVTKDLEPVIGLLLVDPCVNEGSFTINITETTAGITPYYASVNGSAFSLVIEPYTLQNQNSGKHTITIKDVNGCSNTQSLNIYSPLGLSSKVIQLPTCNTADGKIEAMALGGSGNFEYKIDGGSAVSSPNFTGLSSGNHTIFVRDTSTGCENSILVTLEVPTAVTGLTLSQKSVICNAGNDGSITATIATPAVGVNDNPIYKYSIDGINFQESNTFSGLVKGTYTVEVISGRGCIATNTISVSEPAAIVVPTPTVIEFGCSSTNNLNNASISVGGVMGGSEIYTQYEFIKNGTRVQFGPNPTYIESDLAGGSYTVNVYDDKGCSGSASTTISPFYILDKINVNPISLISCVSDETIQVSVSGIGGTPSNLDYSLSPISGSLLGTTFSSNSTGIFSGLTVGEYLITVKNTVTNCTIQDVYTVNEPNTFGLTIDSTSDVTCFGGSNGSATISLVDQSTPSRAGVFSYDVKDSAGNSIQSSTITSSGPITISNLKADTYSIKATLSNAPFCSITKNFTISQPIAALSLSESHSDITCAVGNNDGEIIALPTGGWSDFYEFKWEKGGTMIQDWGDVYELTHLTQGIYKIYVRDAKGCLVDQQVELKNPSPITFNASSDTALLRCFSDRTATISVTSVSGGQGSNYGYTLNETSPNSTVFGSQISNEFKDLGAGKYTVTVTDNWSCKATSGIIEIQEPTHVVATLSLQTAATCMIPAQLNLQISGGTPPYSFSADNSTFSPFLSGVLNGNTGTNHYYVKDNNGCGSYVSNDVVVESPKGLSVTIDTTFAKVNCKGDSTASLLATAQGGLESYSYTLLDEVDTLVRPAQPTGIFTGLPAGKYKVKVTSADCVPAESTIVTITEPTAKLKPTYSLTDVLCAGSNDGTVNITSTGGTVVIKHAISPNLSQFTESNLFENLAPGNYDLLVQDALGCYDKKLVTIGEPTVLSVQTLSTSIVQEICYDDKNAQFSIAISGGTLPYNVSLDNPTGPFTTGSATQTQFDFANLTGGSHTVYIQDAHNCTLDWTVNMDESVKLNPTTIVNYDCVSNVQHNSVTVNLDSSIANFALVQFALDGGVYQSSNVFTNLTPGVHFIRVKHTNGCVKDTPVFSIKKVDPLTLVLQEGGLNEIIAVPNGGGGNYKFTFEGQSNGTNPSYIYYKTQDYLVTVQDANGCTTSATQKFNYIDICIPNYFTPNGDGINDTWAPGCTINYKNLSFTVLDRYGREIQTFQYGESWDGKYQGKELPSGDYWYVLKLNNSKDDREFVGHFTLYR